MSREHNGIGSVGLFAAATALFLLSAPGCQTTVTGGGNNSGSALSSLDGDDGACTSTSIGDGVTCLSMDVAKIQAWDACAADGLVLVDLVMDMFCADGGVAQVSYACCPAVPPPEPDPNICGTEVLGDGVTCLSPEEWKIQLTGGATGVDVCAADGRILQDISLFHDCADGTSSHAKVTCCVSPPPPDPGSVTCDSGLLGDGTACKTDAEWSAEASAVCDPKGFAKFDLGFMHDCADGSSSFAKFICCVP